MVTVNIKISNLLHNGIASTVRFLADFLLFISDIFPAHLGPPYQALFFCVLCEYRTIVQVIGSKSFITAD